MVLHRERTNPALPRRILLLVTVVAAGAVPAVPPAYESVGGLATEASGARSGSPLVDWQADNGKRRDFDAPADRLPQLTDDDRPTARLPQVSDRSGQPVGGKRAYGIPAPLTQAYFVATVRLSYSDRPCNLAWEMLAGIGKVESNHAWDGRVDRRGNTTRPIVGPVLDGARYAAIPDTDGGELDGDPRWDRAVGPMQFIPGSWFRYQADGNGDRVRNPHNIYDAALATASYLCAGDGDLGDSADLAAAIYRYNHSDAYVRAVLGWITAYRNGGARADDVEPAAMEHGDDARSRSPLPSPGPRPTSTEPSPSPAPSPPPAPTTGPSPTPAPRPTATPTPAPTPSPSRWCPIPQLPLCL